MRISDWSSDVCSSDLKANRPVLEHPLYGGSEVIAFQQVEQPSIVSGLPRLGGGEQCQPPTVSLLDRHGILMIGEAQQVEAVRHLVGSSEERRVGKECVGTCMSRWARNHKKKKK